MDQFAVPSLIMMQLFVDLFQRRGELGAQQIVGYAAQRFLTCKAIKLGCGPVPIRNAVGTVANEDGITAQIQQASLFR